MLGRLLKSTLRLFPDRQILVRAEGRVSYIRLSRRVQLALALGSVAAITAITYGLTAPRHHAPLVVQGAAPTAELKAQIDELQRQLAAANALLAKSPDTATVAENKAAVDEADARIKALEEARDRAAAEETDLRRQLSQAQDAASTRMQNMAQLNHTLEANRGELHQSDSQRQALQSRVHQLEQELEGANARTSQAKADLASNERRLQQLAAEHDQTLAERDRLQARLHELQSRVSVPTPPSAADGGAATAPAPQRSTADRPADQRSENAPQAGNNGEIEQVLASTGLDVEKLLGRLNSVPAGQGGPYIALDKKHMPASDARSEELQKILKALPLGVPLAHYTLESGFGGRSDPLNHRQAFHPGLDLAAPYRSPVYSTGPGTVIFTGVKDSYGKVVEIDHGHGIVTRYAHLHRYVVARGQKVPAHFEVGELGSTGRSTGPHLHYEVLVNGTAQDPEKFLQAGKNVVQANGN